VAFCRTLSKIRAAGYFTLAAVSLSLGYFAGKAASSSAAAPAPQTSLQSVEKPSQNPPNAVEAGSDSEDSEDEEHDDTGLESLKVDSGDECKLVRTVSADDGHFYPTLLKNLKIEGVSGSNGSRHDNWKNCCTVSLPASEESSALT